MVNNKFQFQGGVEDRCGRWGIYLDEMFSFAKFTIVKVDFLFRLHILHNSFSVYYETLLDFIKIYLDVMK